MFTIIFTVIAIIFSAICSLQGMEIVSAITLPPHKVVSLKGLCHKAIIESMQSPEGLEKFAKGETGYNKLSQEARDKIAKKLPGRPHRQCRIKTSCKVVFNEKLQKCVMLGDDRVHFVNSSTGDIFYSFDAPEAMDISLSADGNKYFLQCNDQHSTYGWYGEVCYFKQNDLVRNRIDQCFSASFSPRGDYLVVQQPTGLSLWDINTWSKVYEGCQQIKFCSTGERLLVKKNNIVTVVDTTTSKELLKLPETVWAFISNDGKKLFRQKGFLINRPLILLGQLIDIESGLLLQSANCGYMQHDPFSLDGAYVLVFCDNKYELWDVLSGNKKVSLALETMLPEFVLGGKYLFIKTPPEQSPIKKYGCVIAIDELIAYVSENEKYKVTIEDIPKKAETHDYRNLLFPEFGNYIVHGLNKQVWLIDLLNNKSFLFSKMAVRVGFSVFGRMLLLQRKCGDNKHYVDIIRFDNDLTIEQFLFKKLIITHDMTKEQVISDIRWHDIYNSLSPDQKKHFAKQVFK